MPTILLPVRYAENAQAIDDPLQPCAGYTSLNMSLKTKYVLPSGNKVNV